MLEEVTALEEVLGKLAEKGRLAVVCLGNELRGDDAVGLLVCRELESRCPDALSVVELIEAGLDASRVLGLALNGYAVLVVDAVLAEDVDPGDVLLTDSLDVLRRGGATASTHSISLSDFKNVLEGRVALVGVAVNASNMELGAEPSPLMVEASKAVAEMLCKALRRIVASRDCG